MAPRTAAVHNAAILKVEQSMLKALQKRGKMLAVVAGVAALLAMGAMNAGARARDGVVAVIASNIVVDTHDGQLLAKVTIDNHSEHTIYVPRVLANEGEPEGNLFEVRDSSNGDPLDYVGMLVKRALPTKHDYVAIKPHGQLSTRFDISHAYRFMNGRHAYQISFSGAFVNDVNRLDQRTPLDVATAMFAHVGQ
ncbi:hypothetical protein [Massilia sp. PWRC2]|uniref:hypothetical protein n=1 Tax=Massilia sp. PWRC2 TaxID=2804626 RepID=UPI003CF2C521